jgi:tripartite-type tricarboxylate transporter receptor subunit TctC
VIDDKRRAEINEIMDRFNEMLKDPDFQRDVQEFVRTANRLTPEQLNRRFTI